MGKPRIQKKAPRRLQTSRGCETKDSKLKTNYLSSELQFKKLRVKIPENSSKHKHLAKSIVNAISSSVSTCPFKCLVEKALVPRLEERSPALRDSFIFFQKVRFQCLVLLYFKRRPPHVTTKNLQSPLKSRLSLPSSL